MNDGDRLKRLLDRGLISREEFDGISGHSRSTGAFIEQALIDKGIPKHELLFSLSERYSRPYAEFDESVVVSAALLSCTKPTGPFSGICARAPFLPRPTSRAFIPTARWRPTCSGTWGRTT